MTPLCKVEVTLPRVLGSREVRRGGGVRIKQRLSLQKDTCQGKQSIRDTTESTTVRVATFAQRSISGATPWDRAEWRHVPSDRPYRAIGRAQHSA